MSEFGKYSNKEWKIHLLIAVAVQVTLPALIIGGIIPFSWRLYILALVGVAFAIWAIILRVDGHLLGLRQDNLKQAMILQMPTSVLFLAMLLLAPTLGLGKRFEAPTIGFFIFYVLISSPCQEFIYRSFLYALCKEAQLSKVKIFLLLTLPYVWVHAIYKDAITIIFSAIVGIAWALAYMKTPNLWAVSLSHALLGVVTIVLGLI